MGLYKKIVGAMLLPIYLSTYFNRRTGRQYGIGFGTKLWLVFKMMRNGHKIETKSSFLEHLLMATSIMQVPKHVEGAVVECGSYKGGSTTNLSLVCKLVKRRLEVCDSFEGLPEPAEADRKHINLSKGQIETYSKGDFVGALDEVKRNITTYGDISVCTFHKGYYEDTLPHFKEKCVFMFLDVDLRTSLVDCIVNLWPLLQDGGYVYTHEAPHFMIAYLFYDIEWWKQNFNSNAPGLVGAGNGLGLWPMSGGAKSSLGFTVKNPSNLKIVQG
jgi:O-methyltransferase